MELIQLSGKVEVQALTNRQIALMCASQSFTPGHPAGMIINKARDFLEFLEGRR